MIALIGLSPPLSEVGSAFTSLFRTTLMRMRFCDCRLDTDARQLFRNAQPVPLSPKAFQLLKLLIEQRPRALSKDELLERVWPDVFVSPVSLAWPG
jgi:DNA-binding winged helix-turn-helix (wHTH) protein